MSKWSTAVRSDYRVFDELADWWNELPAVEQNPHLHTDILNLWARLFIKDGEPLHIRVLHRDGEPVAALALFERKKRLRSFLDKASFDVVASADPDVTERLPLWMDSIGVAHLYRVHERSPIVAALDQRPRWLVRRIRSSKYIDLSGGIDQVQADLNSKLKRNLRRARKLLEELGEVRFVDHPSPSDVDTVLEMGLKLEMSGWKGQQGVAVLSKPDQEKWYRSLAEIAENAGQLRLSSLHLDDRIVAFTYELASSEARFGLITTYDDSPEIARLSVGNLLREDVVEKMCADGFKRYELGHGQAADKMRWSSGESSLYDISVYGSGVMGRLSRLAQRGASVKYPRIEEE